MMILRLVDLPWYDVVYTRIFIRLDLRDLCRLRCVSTEYRVLVDNYLATWDTLDLSPYSNFEPASFEGLVRACEGLRRVNLRNSYWLGSSHLVDLLGVHPGLTHLDLTGCNGLHMRRCNFIETTKCRNLTSVRLRGCAWVTADFLSTLLRFNRNLRELELADCYQISDEAVVSMFEYRTALTSICLERSTISDKSLYVISNHGEAMESLDLRSCPRITDKGLMLLRSLQCLKRLSVRGCTSVTERGLAPLRGRVEIDLHPSPICRIQPPNLQV